MQQARPSHLKTDIALLFAVLVWGLNFPILKAALATMHPFVVNALRFLVSAGVLGAVFAWRQRNAALGFRETVGRFWKQIVGLGIVGYLLYQLFFIIGIDHTFAGNAALIMTSSPLWTAAVGHAAGLERLRGAAWLGLLVSLIGTVVIVFGGAQRIDFASSTFFGNLMMLGAAAMWGTYTAFSRPVMKHLLPSSLTFLGLLVALPVLLLLSVPHLGEVQWEQVDAWVWFAIVFSGGLSTGLTLVIWNAAVRTVGASQTAVFNNLVPLVAVLASAVLLSEPVTAVQIAGGLLIIGGLLLTRRARGQ